MSLRWGTNGLAFTTVQRHRAVGFICKTELVSNAAPIPTEFSLRRSSLSVGTPTISIKVARTGDITGTASINFATSDGTATAGSDYCHQRLPRRLSKNISIPIFDDNLFETGNETFTLTLSNPTGGAILTAPVRALSTSVTMIPDPLFRRRRSRCASPKGIRERKMLQST